MTGTPVAAVEDVGRSSIGVVEYVGALAVQFWQSLRGISHQSVRRASIAVEACS